MSDTKPEPCSLYHDGESARELVGRSIIRVGLLTVSAMHYMYMRETERTQTCIDENVPPSVAKFN